MKSVRLEPRKGAEWGRTFEIWRRLPVKGSVEARSGLGRYDAANGIRPCRMKKAQRKSPAIRARQRASDGNSPHADDVVQEPVPEDFMDLLRQIDESLRTRGARRSGCPHPPCLPIPKARKP